MQTVDTLLPYQQSYLNRFDSVVSFQSGNVLDALGLTFEMTLDLFSIIYPEQILYRYAENKWSLAELFGHMIDTERIFSYRALRIARGDLEQFHSFDQDKYVEVSHYENRSFESIRQEFYALEEATAFLFEGLNEEELNKKGYAGGVEITPRTIGFLTAAHRWHHIEIIKERYLSK